MWGTTAESVSSITTSSGLGSRNITIIQITDGASWQWGDNIPSPNTDMTRMDSTEQTSQTQTSLPIVVVKIQANQLQSQKCSLFQVIIHRGVVRGSRKQTSNVKNNNCIACVMVLINGAILALLCRSASYFWSTHWKPEPGGGVLSSSCSSWLLLLRTAPPSGHGAALTMGVGNQVVFGVCKGVL